MNIKNVLIRAIIGAVLGWYVGQLFNKVLGKTLKTLGDHKNLLTLEDKTVLQNFIDTDPFMSGIWDGRPETAREGRTISQIAEDTIAKLEREGKVFGTDYDIGMSEAEYAAYKAKQGKVFLYPNSPRSILESFKDKIDDFKDFIDAKVNAREYRLLEKQVDEERADLPLDVEAGLDEVLHPSQRNHGAF